MLSTAKILNTLTSTSSTGNLFSNTNLTDQTIQRPGPMSLPLNPQQLYHHSTSSPTNPSGGLSLTAQLRSKDKKKQNQLL
jgi:hypothetical protein